MSESNIQSAPVFRLGICMAGAVSAGAYTAGVMDYLLEALEAYEAKRGTPGYPSHKVEIPVIGGASAGGMTSIITAAAFQQGITHIDKPLDDVQQERPENILYHSWVDLTDRDMFKAMLDPGDISAGDVVSGFNCTFIDEVARRVIRPTVPDDFQWKPLPNFFADRLKVFTTLSNLQGFGYNVAFKTEEMEGHRPYYMQMHQDFACFELLKEGIEPDGKGWMPFNVKTGENSKIAIDAAMATGAFPVGLRPRKVSRPSEAVNNNPFFDSDTLKAIKVDDEPYITLNVDGGMINNEPFDKVRELLGQITGQPNPTDYESYKRFKSTVLMIAPFPSTKPDAISLADKLFNVAGLTFSAMLSQMRAKASELKSAMDKDCAGQFLIDPSRKVQQGGKLLALQGERAIACGALGGFSGFINKEFRVHDFFLGRHNCKVFLRDYFTVPDKDVAENEIFREGYAGVDASKFRGADNNRQIIPIVDEQVDYTFPKINFRGGNPYWPVQKQQAIDAYKGALKSRVNAIIMNIVAYNPFQKFLIKAGSFIILSNLLATSALKTLKQELSSWGLLSDLPPAAPTPDAAIHSVTFEATVSANLKNMDVLIQDCYIPSPELIVNYHQSSITGTHLDVVFQLTAAGEAAYSIQYSCACDGQQIAENKVVTGKIDAKGYKEVKVTVNFPVKKNG